MLNFRLLSRPEFDISIKGNGHYSPAHVAALYGGLQWLKRAKEMRPDELDVNSSDETGQRLLHLACVKDNLGIIIN